MIYHSDLQYFPVFTSFIAPIKGIDIKFPLYEIYEKRSFGNRAKVASADGPLLLSIPLLGGRDQRRPWLEVRIDHRQKWQLHHFKTLQSCYNRSPWFDYFGHELQELYELEFDFLWEWNFHCFSWAASKLGMSIDSSSLVKSRSAISTDLAPAMDMLNEWGPDRSPHYTQVFQDRTGFLPGLSVLDLLFCTGPSARNVLENSGGWLEEKM